VHPHGVERAGVPAFIYHGFYRDRQELHAVDKAEWRYHLPVDAFAQHMELLAAAGLAACSLADWLTSPAANHVVLTFDDGHISNYEQIWPLLVKRSFNATLFIVTSWIGLPGRIRGSQLRELSEHGVQIGSHGHTHRPMTGLDGDSLQEELRCSKAALEDLLGKDVDCLAIPGGFSDARLAPAVRQAGYRHLCTSRPGLALPDFEVPRFSVTQATTNEQLRSLALRRPGSVARARLQFHLLQTSKRLIGVKRYEALYAALGRLAGRS
jgi:peptidoglycan/xylan/chitin deacetylase (PgdA/CDA1 family)